MLLFGVGGPPAAGGASYQVTDAYVYIPSLLGGTNVKICIYSAAGALLSGGCSAGATIATGWVHVTFSAGPTLVAGTRYQIGPISDGFFTFRDDNTTSGINYTDTGTYASPPATIDATGGAEISLGEFSIYATNASAQVLIGNNAVETTEQTGNNDTLYVWATGYVCATL